MLSKARPTATKTCSSEIGSKFGCVAEFKAWFETHISLSGNPYTLDLDQAQAVYDHHKNTLVTARAGSGKTRVIVAKVAYLIASGQLRIDEIKVFMFNRTAAAEVNERIGAVEIDGVPLRDYCHREKIQVASTFHKFALDIIKLQGERPQLISESEHDDIIKKSVRKVLLEEKRKISRPEYEETLRLASSFIARAGQKFLGEEGLSRLCQTVEQYIQKYQANDNYQSRIRLHKTCLAAYQEYLLTLNYPKIDFNILMVRATRILKCDGAKLPQITRLKYIMVDEYQDFSLLFLSIIQAVRQNCPAAHLFAVGDDWQAINRFAGSDVDYFINFASYFPEDMTNIDLTTNYRSDRKIVENANHYMLKNYDKHATKATPFSKHNGKIKRLPLQKVKFDAKDLQEDGLGDARFQKNLAEVCGGVPGQYQEAAQLLKLIYKLLKKHRKKEILFLHRHNFTSFAGISLEDLIKSLKLTAIREELMEAGDFDARIRAMTMHKSKGLESDVVIMLETNREQILSSHPHATIFELFGDTLEAEKADQQRLLYVAMTRAKHRLYMITSDKKCPI